MMVKPIKTDFSVDTFRFFAAVSYIFPPLRWQSSRDNQLHGNGSITICGFLWMHSRIASSFAFNGNTYFPVDSDSLFGRIQSMATDISFRFFPSVFPPPPPTAYIDCCCLRCVTREPYKIQNEHKTPDQMCLAMNISPLKRTNEMFYRRILWKKYENWYETIK